MIRNSHILCDSFAVNPGANREGPAGHRSSVLQLTACAGEAPEAKSGPADDAVTTRPRGSSGDSLDLRRRVKATNPGNNTGRVASAHSKVKENLNLGYRRKDWVAYVVFRQPLVGRKVVWDSDFRHSSWSMDRAGPGGIERPTECNYEQLERRNSREVLVFGRGGSSAATFRGVGWWKKPMPHCNDGDMPTSATIDMKIRKSEVTT